MAEIEAIAKLVNQLSKLPGVGRKTAQRLAYHIIGHAGGAGARIGGSHIQREKADHLARYAAITRMWTPSAHLFRSQRRHDIVCVVRDPRDVNAMERMRDYNGLYHVLHGVISPMDGVGPDDIRIRELMSRLASGEIEEVVLATNPDVEGEATAAYHLPADQAHGRPGDPHCPRRPCRRGSGIHRRGDPLRRLPEDGALHPTISDRKWGTEDL